MTTYERRIIMEDKIQGCIDILTGEIETQRNKDKGIFDVTGLIAKGTMNGLELARMLLIDYWEDNN